jgi:hypothetical protein
MHLVKDWEDGMGKEEAVAQVTYHIDTREDNWGETRVTIAMIIIKTQR